MADFLTPSNITFVLGILAILFSVYNYFRNPQIKSEKTESALMIQFSILQKELANLKDNHIHTIEKKIEDTNNNLNVLTNQVTKLATIIEERIPRKL